MLWLPQVRPEFRATARKKKDAERRVIHDACSKLDRMGLLHGNPAAAKPMARAPIGRSVAPGAPSGRPVAPVAAPTAPAAFDGSFRADPTGGAAAAVPPTPPVARGGGDARDGSDDRRSGGSDDRRSGARGGGSDRSDRGASKAAPREDAPQPRAKPKKAKPARQGSPANQALNKELRRMAEAGELLHALSRFIEAWGAVAKGGRVAAAKTKDLPERGTIIAMLTLCVKCCRPRKTRPILDAAKACNIFLTESELCNILIAIPSTSDPEDASEFLDKLNTLAKFQSPVAGALEYWSLRSHLILREFLDEALQCRSGTRSKLGYAQQVRGGAKGSEIVLMGVFDQSGAKLQPSDAINIVVDEGIGGVDAAGRPLNAVTCAVGIDGVVEAEVVRCLGSNEIIAKSLDKRGTPQLKKLAGIASSGGGKKGGRRVPDRRVKVQWLILRGANRMAFSRQLAALRDIVTRGGEATGGKKSGLAPHLALREVLLRSPDATVKVQAGATAAAKALHAMSTREICAMQVEGGRKEKEILDELVADKDVDSGRGSLGRHVYNPAEGLNPSQRQAVAAATARRLTLIQGPPGTGKTRCSIAILANWVKQMSATCKPNEKILATSGSNIAVDNLVEGLAAAGVHVLRLGRPESIRPEMTRHCLDYIVQSAPSSGGGGGGDGRDRADAHRRKMRALNDAKVICATCIGAGAGILDRYRFPYVLIDEATQSTEPQTVVPMCKGARQIVLVGDHCQLPPTVISEVAEDEGLAISLFSRLVELGVPPMLLDTQYRMHPKIAEFPSDTFYGGHLRSGIRAADRPAPVVYGDENAFRWPNDDSPVALIDVAGTEDRQGTSHTNQNEALTALDVIMSLLRTCRIEGVPVQCSSIGLVTP